MIFLPHPLVSSSCETVGSADSFSEPDQSPPHCHPRSGLIRQAALWWAITGLPVIAGSVANYLGDHGNVPCPLWSRVPLGLSFGRFPALPEPVWEKQTNCRHSQGGSPGPGMSVCCSGTPGLRCVGQAVPGKNRLSSQS